MSMTVQQVKKELWKIAESYPTLQGVLQKELPNGTTVGTTWANTLKDLHPVIFGEVCDDYSSLVKPLPVPIDQLAFEIRAAVQDRYHKDMDKMRQHTEYFSKRPTGAMEWVASDRIGHIAIELGKRVREGTLSKADNDVMMDELMAYARGKVKDKPDWMESMVRS